MFSLNFDEFDIVEKFEVESWWDSFLPCSRWSMAASSGSSHRQKGLKTTALVSRLVSSQKSFLAKQRTSRKQKHSEQRPRSPSPALLPEGSNPSEVNTVGSLTLLQKVAEIPGLRCMREFLTAENASNIVNLIDSLPWNRGPNALKRRTQQYGYQYDYSSVKPPAPASEFPPFAKEIAFALFQAGIFALLPDQLIINEYHPGQGISAHIDHPTQFGDTVVSISVCGSCFMQFASKQNESKHNFWFSERSLIILQGAARYNWTHSILSRKSDFLNGAKVQRTRRLSLTFRCIQKTTVIDLGWL